MIIEEIIYLNQSLFSKRMGFFVYCVLRLVLTIKNLRYAPCLPAEAS